VSRKMMLLAAIAAVVLTAVAPALAASWSPTDSAKGTFGKGNSGKNKDFSGLVDIGGGREMYLECHGKGSPTLSLFGAANHLLNPDDVRHRRHFPRRRLLWHHVSL
jgi:hypothetical protein